MALPLVASLSAILTVSILFVTVLAIRRISFHALGKYPGPFFAAVTSYYRAYYDIVMDGGWTEHLATLHETYGPVVRVGPNELHFNDPRAHSDIYGMTSRFTKQPALYSCFATDLSVFALFDIHEAMQRRNLIGPFFSRRAILNLENVIQSKVDILVSRLLAYQSKKPANIDFAYRSTSLEVITSYCFAKSSEALDAKDFQHDILAAMDATLPMIWVFRHFPTLKRLLLMTPDWLAGLLRPNSRGILDQRKQMGAQIDEILKNPSSLDNIDHETVYHYFMTPQPDNARLPPLTREWLLDEGIYMRFAGSDTVGNVCTVGTFYLLTDPRVQEVLFNELLEAWPDKESALSLEALEKLPYLTAVIKESLRMANGIVTPLPRIVGPTDAAISGIKVPAGTVVSMGHSFVHRDANIFAEPSTFRPERWLEADSANLERYLVAFSKGPRSCLGINLAWAELYLIFGNIFRKLDLQPDDVSLASISWREYFVPVHRGRHLHAHVRPRKV